MPHPPSPFLLLSVGTLCACSALGPSLEEIFVGTPGKGEAIGAERAQGTIELFVPIVDSSQRSETGGLSSPLMAFLAPSRGFYIRAAAGVGAFHWLVTDGTHHLDESVRALLRAVGICPGDGSAGWYWSSVCGETRVFEERSSEEPVFSTQPAVDYSDEVSDYLRRNPLATTADAERHIQQQSNRAGIVFGGGLATCGSGEGLGKFSLGSGEFTACWYPGGRLHPEHFLLAPMRFTSATGETYWLFFVTDAEHIRLFQARAGDGILPFAEAAQQVAEALLPKLSSRFAPPILQVQVGPIDFGDDTSLRAPVTLGNRSFTAYMRVHRTDVLQVNALGLVEDEDGEFFDPVAQSFRLQLEIAVSQHARTRETKRQDLYLLVEVLRALAEGAVATAVIFQSNQPSFRYEIPFERVDGTMRLREPRVVLTGRGNEQHVVSGLHNTLRSKLSDAERSALVDLATMLRNVQTNDLGDSPPPLRVPLPVIVDDLEPSLPEEIASRPLIRTWRVYSGSSAVEATVDVAVGPDGPVVRPMYIIAESPSPEPVRVRVRFVAAQFAAQDFSVHWRGGTLPAGHAGYVDLELTPTADTAEEWQRGRVQSGGTSAFFFLTWRTRPGRADAPLFSR